MSRFLDDQEHRPACYRHEAFRFRVGGGLTILSLHVTGAPEYAAANSCELEARPVRHECIRVMSGCPAALIVLLAVGAVRAGLRIVERIRRFDPEEIDLASGPRELRVVHGHRHSARSSSWLRASPAITSAALVTVRCSSCVLETVAPCLSLGSVSFLMTACEA